VRDAGVDGAEDAEEDGLCGALDEDGGQGGVAEERRAVPAGVDDGVGGFELASAADGDGGCRWCSMAGGFGDRGRWWGVVIWVLAPLAIDAVSLARSRAFSLLLPFPR
jgi:hypothetical protein